MITKSFKWHPQPSSVRKSTEAAKRATSFKGATILDCFCGGGSHGVASIRAGAKKYIGTDLEDYSFCLRKDIARYNSEYQNFGEKTISFIWGLDAAKSIISYDYDILFIDPPNPYQIVGGATKSVIRDTGLSGSQLTKFWKPRLNPENLINKREGTISKVREIVFFALTDKKRVIANLFRIKSNGFDYSEQFKDEFKLTPIFESYYEISLGVHPLRKCVITGDE